MLKLFSIFALAAAILASNPGQAHAPLMPPAPWEPRPMPDRLFAEPDPAVELLARIIHAEARGESYEGQVAVGAVVLNRVANDRFPRSIQDVIYQPRQFTPVSRGLPEAGAPARRAARAALAGEDPTGGSLYFYNPRTARDEWIRSRETVCEIGGHRFAR